MNYFEKLESRFQQSNRPTKKYMVKIDGKTIHFGQKGAKASPGTPRGDAFCARHKPTKNKKSAQYWARKIWNCRGTKSVKTAK